MTGNSKWGILILISVSYVIYWHWWNFVFCMLGVMNLNPASSGPDILLLLLKALTSISAHILSNKTHMLSIEFFNWFLFDYFMSINWPETCSIQKITGKPPNVHSHFQHFLKGQTVYSMPWVQFQQSFYVTPQLFHLHTPCGAYKLDYVVYECLCIQPSLLLPGDDLQSEHTIQWRLAFGLLS